MQKNKSGYGYKYVTEDEILAKVTAGMEKNNISLIPMIKSGTGQVAPYKYVDKKGKDAYEILVNADMVFRWVDDENPEDFIDVEWLLVGQQGDAAQAFGAGLTYSNRYFLMKYFQMSTVDDDPDGWRSKQQEVLDADIKEELSKMKASIVELAKAKVDSGVDKEKVYGVIEAHTNGKKNPNVIRDIDTAKTVYEEINKMEATNIE